MKKWKRLAPAVGATWTAADAARLTPKASTDALRLLWACIANDAMWQGMSDRQAIRLADAAVKREVWRLHAMQRQRRLASL